MNQREARKSLVKAGIEPRRGKCNHEVFRLPTGYTLTLNGGNKPVTLKMQAEIRKALG